MFRALIKLGSLAEGPCSETPQQRHIATIGETPEKRNVRTSVAIKVPSQYSRRNVRRLNGVVRIRERVLSFAQNYGEVNVVKASLCNGSRIENVGQSICIQFVRDEVYQQAGGNYLAHGKRSIAGFREYVHIRRSHEKATSAIC